MLLLSPLRPAERSILFSEKSVRLSDDARSAASSHAPKKGCGVREVWRSQTCTSGSPFFCLLFFGEAKKRKCPAGMKRMVKATPQADHKAVTFFQAASNTSHNAPILFQAAFAQFAIWRRAVAAPFAFQAAFGGPQILQPTPNNLHPTICGSPPACITILNSSVWQLSGCLNSFKDVLCITKILLAFRKMGW